MKQIILDLKTGVTSLEEVPAPLVRSGCVLIKTTKTLVSFGTERALVDFGKANLVEKVGHQPDKVKQTLDKLKTDGIVSVVTSVKNKMGQPLPLGYCNVGEVVAVGNGVTGFAVGDSVASNGPHAEYVCVPKNLVAKIPNNVSDDEAAFTVIGSIGLEGVRLLMPEIGETIVVIGLGVCGLLVSQLLCMNGCKVIGVEFDQAKLDKAKNWGVIPVNPEKGDDQIKIVEELTNGNGADGVIITASSREDSIIHNACLMSRKRGRIVLVGVVGLNIRRDDFYKKELSFQVSCSYGPGRYDNDFENKGVDYPLPFVRWTEKRHFETILQLIAQGKLDVKPLITESVELENFHEIYSEMGKRGSIASILEYNSDDDHIDTVVKIKGNKSSSGKIGIIGAGNYTSATLVPIMKRCGAKVKYVASAGGLTAKIVAKHIGAENATSDYHEILNDSEVDLVIITTRHNAHSKMIVEALSSGKSVLVEKPLCLNDEELNGIIEAYKEAESGITLTVGFNRRFSPFAVKLKSMIGDGPKNIVATMNAGFIAKDVWVHDMEIGGGRIIGEACHFIDLCSYLAGSKVVSVCMNALGENLEENTDNASILLRYENGTNAVINYFANGSKSYSKERVEVFSQERVFILDNWRTLTGFGTKQFHKMKGRLDKGHKSQFALLNKRITEGGDPLIPFDSIINTTKASFAAIRSLKERRWVDVQ